MTRRLIGMLLAFAVLVGDGRSAVAQAPQSAAGTPAQVVVLIDGSGSMWGGLGGDGVAKIAGIRRALEAALPQIAGRHPIGVATFGPGCRSAELAAAPGVVPLETTLAPLQKFNPRGKGPLVAGLEAAAQSFDPAAAGHVLLFHDGLDNCGQNACTAAAALKASHPRLAVHTLSLGLEGAELKAMACVADSTGGQAFAVADHAALDSAVDELVAMIAGGAEPAAASSAAGEAAENAPPPAAPQGPSRLVASASLAAGAAHVTSSLQWRVLDAADGRLLHEAVSPSIAIELRPGKVRVQAASGQVEVSREIEIAAAGDTIADLSLEAGIARFETGARKLANEADEPLIRLDSLTSVEQAYSAAQQPTEAASGNAGKAASREPQGSVSTPLWIARGTAAEAILPPGTYRAVAEFGLARAQAVITVTAGSEANVALPLEAGRLELALDGRSAAAGVVYTIAVDDPSEKSGQRIVARSAHPAAAFILSTGSYTVTASIAGHETRRVLAVRQGEVTRETFGEDLGRVTVTATLNGGALAAHSGVTLTVAPLSRTDAAEDVVSARIGKPIPLPPGRYGLTLRAVPGGPSVTKAIELAAGQDMRVALDLALAEVTITGTARSGGGTPATCELRSDAGSVVWRGVEVDPRAVVAPGRYTLRCNAGLVRREAPLALTAGARITVAPFTQ